jgi:hypothetical protein
MNRRAFLAVAGSAVVAGCGGQSEQTPVVGVGDMDELGATTRTCDEDVANEGSASLDGRRVSVEGTIVGEAICAKPSGHVLTGSEQTAGTVTIVIEAAVPGQRDCEECRTRVDYEGSVRLDSEPETVTLEHVTLDGGQTEVARVTTIETDRAGTAETGTAETPAETTTRDR